jgi:predicted dehydrogenase
MPLARVPGYGAEGLALMRRFCGAIRGVGTSGYRIEDAITTLRVIEAAHHAAAQGTTVEVGNV